MNVEYLGI